jgi:hypothetical protein
MTADGVLKLCGFGEPAWLMDRSHAETPANDLAALGKLAATWIIPPASSKKARGKPLPAAVQEMLDRLNGTEAVPPFTSASEVLETLDRVGAEIPANAATWDRFVRAVSEQATDAALRLSA